MNAQERTDVRELVNGIMITAKVIDRHIPQVIIRIDDETAIKKLKDVLICIEDVKRLAIKVNNYLNDNGR